jgi:hypothetical protein
MTINEEKTLLNVIALTDNVIRAENKITIYEDGNVVSSKREVDFYNPDMDINSIESEEVKKLANELWTQEVISEYNASLNPQP